MSRIRWSGVPEAYWPDTERPWRVSWGFGAFRDFATREEGEAFYATLRPGLLPNPPWNVIEQGPDDAEQP